MELYIGGFCQGKLKYVKEKKNIIDESLIAWGESCQIEEIYQKPIINRFHLFLKRMQMEEQNLEELLKKLVNDNPNVIIICDEVGMGIVPLDRTERYYRELVGRTCCFLAEKAETVERIIAGIGMKLC